MSIREWDIPYEELKIMDKIGSGRFSTVHKGRCPSASGTSPTRSSRSWTRSAAEGSVQCTRADVHPRVGHPLRGAQDHGQDRQRKVQYSAQGQMSIREWDIPYEELKIMDKIGS